MKHRQLELGNKNIIGARVTQLRKERHMTQKQLMAQLQTKGVDINSSSLSKLEGQTRSVSDRELAALAQIFEVDLEEMYGKASQQLEDPVATR